jgi:hypothetical protein
MSNVNDYCNSKAIKTSASKNQNEPDEMQIIAFF